MKYESAIEFLYEFPNYPAASEVAYAYLGDTILSYRNGVLKKWGAQGWTEALSGKVVSREDWWGYVPTKEQINSNQWVIKRWNQKSD